jgi:hypothetical protein
MLRFRVKLPPAIAYSLHATQLSGLILQVSLAGVLFFPVTHRFLCGGTTMPAKRILFVPWPLEEIKEGNKKDGWTYADKNNKWVEQHRAREAAKVENATGDAPYEAKEISQVFWRAGSQSSLLSNLGPNDQVYIRGHGLPSCTFIFLDVRKKDPWSQQPAEPFNILQAEDVAQRLQDRGLPTSFAGTIKCYDCHSNEGGANSFAQAFANAMLRRGYDQCRFMGYQGKLDSYPGSDKDKPDHHKHSTHDGLRAKQNRFPVQPQVPAHPN